MSSKTLEEIVAEHPLPWEGHCSEDYLVEDARGFQLGVRLTKKAIDLQDAAPAMALAIRALIRTMGALPVEVPSDEAKAHLIRRLDALHASLPEEFRP